MSYDSVGNPISEGCILRVYHFTGANNKRHYMYEQVGKYSKINKMWHVYYLPIQNFKKPDGYFAQNFSNAVVVGTIDPEYIQKDLKRNKKYRD